jgi:hypothetical protein
MLDKFDDLPKLIMGMLKNKETVLNSIFRDIEKCNKTSAGLRRVCDSVVDNPSDENLRKMVKTTMKCVADQSEMITRLSIIALVYSGGRNYDVDTATILNKLGHGREAIREMFKQKMGGL